MDFARDFEDIFGFTRWSAIDHYMDNSRCGISRAPHRRRVRFPSSDERPSGIDHYFEDVIDAPHCPKRDLMSRRGSYAERPPAILRRGRSQSDSENLNKSSYNSLPTYCKSMPPNYEKNSRQTYREQLPYKLFEVSPRSQEHATIAELINPLRTSSIKQIVNPTLWRQFCMKRKEMIMSKSDDVALLEDVGCTSAEMKTCLQYTKNFTKHQEIANVPYNDNMSLLYHCTNNRKNIDSILTTGLDERMGNGGLLGKGIYFADKTSKSMSYDGCGGVMFICAVLLGDCLSTDSKQHSDLVVEPKKDKNAKRHHNDLCFDSIVGQPLGDNEYVIYNRNQCIPLYMINCEKTLDSAGYSGYGSLAFPGHGYPLAFPVHGPPLAFPGVGYSSAFPGHGHPMAFPGYGSVRASTYGGHASYKYGTDKQELPPFCWRSSGRSKTPLPNADRLTQNTWPFFASRVFEKMANK